MPSSSDSSSASSSSSSSESSSESSSSSASSSSSGSSATSSSSSSSISSSTSSSSGSASSSASTLDLGFQPGMMSADSAIQGVSSPSMALRVSFLRWKVMPALTPSGLRPPTVLTLPPSDRKSTR